MRKIFFVIFIGFVLVGCASVDVTNTPKGDYRVYDPTDPLRESRN
jgi:hypothetical protein